MPLDGHSYLVAQGWSGKGTGLRQGAISRPLAIHQKKTLAGLGKDRDEAFPFWDHLFAAAANTIKIKVTGDDEDADSSESSATNFKRTSTGILSNRRPVTGNIADSGSTTPEQGTSRLSLMSSAKREAAKRGLYSRFFRGPILGPTDADELDRPSQPSSSGGTIQAEIPAPSKKRKSDETPEERKERKHQKKERKEAKLARKEVRRTKKAGTSFEDGNEEKRARKEPKILDKDAMFRLTGDNGHREGTTRKEGGKQEVAQEVEVPQRRSFAIMEIKGATKKSKKSCQHLSELQSDPSEETNVRKKKRKREAL